MSSRIQPEPPFLGETQDVVKQQRDDQNDVFMDEPVGVVAWVKARWWAVALVTLLLVGCLVAVIVAPVCATVGCSHKASSEQAEPSAPRLIVSFNLSTIDALDVIPAILHQYTTRLKLDSSLLQILDFVDEDVLQEAVQYLQANQNLQLLTRDFAMRYYPDGVDSNTTGLPDLSALLGPDATSLLASGNLSDLAASVSNVLGQVAGRKLRGATPQHHGSAAEGAARRLHQQQDAASVQIDDPLIVNGSQWHHVRIRTPVAWSTSEGAATVIVAVIDTGFDLTHPDLVGRFWVNKREIPGNGIDDDGNGYVDDYTGYAFKGGCKPGTANTATTTCTCQGTPSLTPANAHGTHVAGLIGAALNNDLGGAGTAPQVHLMLLKVADCSTAGRIDASTVLTALDYAYKMGAHIVSMSLGSDYAYNKNGGGQPRSRPPDDRYQRWLASYTQAIKPLESKGVLVLAAAGNENLDMDALYNLGYTYTPCMVPLGNMLCIGATDSTDSRAFFSNYGQKVHMSAPGTYIMSTLWNSTGADASAQHTYGIMHGTSQATPITAGVAALVASVLGSQDKNYYKASKVREILLTSGDFISSLQGYTSSQMRLNAFNALQLALESITSAAGIPSLSPAIRAGALPSSVALPGFTETYWYNGNPRVLSSRGLTPLDQTVRSGGPSFSRFKYTSSAMVNMSAALQLNTSGLHTFTIAYPQSFLGGRVMVNGMDLGVTNTSTSGTASFKASAPGWYNVSFVLVPVPAGAVTVQLTPPGAAQASLFPSSYTTWTSAKFAAPTVTNNYTDASSQGWGLNSGWLVFYNRTASTGVVLNSSAINVLSQQVTFDSVWESQAVVSDLTSPAGSFTSMLSPNVALDSIMGYATTIWNVFGVSANVMFTVTCKACSVLLNGQPVLDNWEAFNSRISLPKTSSCVNIDPRAKQYRVDVKFVAASNSALFLAYSPCPPAAARFIGLNQELRASLSPAVIDYSNTVAQAYIGWVPGVQCDVWPAIPGSASVPLAAPTYKVRLPTCASPQLFNSTCSSLWAFTLDSLVPGGLAASAPNRLYSVRCWAYTSVNLPTRLTAGPLTASARVLLAGLPRYQSSSLPGGLLISPVPRSIDYGQTYQQLLVEWAGVSPTQTLSLLGDGVPVPIKLTSFRLPIWTTADPTGSLNPVDPLFNMRTVGTQGIYLQAYVANSADVAGLVTPNVAQVASAAGTLSNSTSALSSTYTFPALANKVGYVVTEGFYWTIDSTPAFNTLVFDQPAGTSTLVTAGDVVVFNSRAFSASAPAVSQTAVQVFVPSGYLRLRIVTKVSNAQGAVKFSWLVRSSHPDTVVDDNYWVRTAWAP